MRSRRYPMCKPLRSRAPGDRRSAAAVGLLRYIEEVEVFYHVKELQFNARVSGPDPRFATLLLEQFGGGNGELKAAMQYFVQAFGARQPYPDKYDLLMDIATEEFSHLEIVGATITMLLEGVSGELKDAIHQTSLSKVMGGKAARRVKYFFSSALIPAVRLLPARVR